MNRSWRSLLPKDAAANLAVFRITVGLLLLFTREVQTAAASWADLPAALAIAPRGWTWALAVFPPSPTAARAAQIVLGVGALLGAIGCFARTAFACVTVAALFLLALPLRTGLPYHYQHLVWFAALCAASPCADALSIDRWRKSRAAISAPGPSAAYGIPIRVAWLLIGAVFFFPGLWKLRASGLDWITSDNLRNLFYWKWAVTPGLIPPFRIDRFPGLLHLGAAGVVFLELTFAFAVWFRSLRILAVVAALVFHVFARTFMGIDFSGLWFTYVVFVDWDALTKGWSSWKRGDPPRPTLPEPTIDPVVRPLTDPLTDSLTCSRIAAVLVLGAALVIGAVEAGIRGVTTGWPFACYPTFQERTGIQMPVLIVALVNQGGREVPVNLSPEGEPGDLPRERAFGLTLIATAGTPGAPDRFAAYWLRLSGRAALRPQLWDIRAVRFYAGQMSTVPEERRRPPSNLRLVYELAIGEPPSTMIPRARSGAITWPSRDASAKVK